ncbi:MAG: hypothetical protein KA175_08000 [Flavobacteriales bacterium]|nr:hypothetical protein [Flavobacteriales bacterium]MBP6697546.1 hypothetical protein [Flavobacteriales bacterium]
MTGFRHMGDGRTVSVLEHVRAQLDLYPDAEILVGSDSHNRGDRTVYTTAVVLRYRRNGAHVLYRRERHRRVQDMWTRLWGEVERSIYVAQWLTREGQVKVRCIDLDLNSDPKFGSHRLHSTAIGYVRAHGYEARTKPELLMASWAANILCNGDGGKHETPTGLSPRQG